MAVPGSQLPGIPAATSIADADPFYTVQGGLDRRGNAGQMRAYLAKGLPASPARIKSIQTRLQEGISVSEFTSIQAAVDEAIGLQLAGSGVFKVTLPPATYTIDEPIRLMAYSGSAYAPFSVALVSEAHGYQYGLSTEIVKSFKDNPGIIIQNGRNVRVAGIQIRGIASITVPTYEGLLKDSSSPWWNTNAARDERYSPDCAIHIDPFSTGGAPSDGGYPGFTSYYNASGGSNGVVLEDVSGNRNIVGIAIGLAPNTTQGEAIQIIRPNLSQNKVCVAVGQNQSRGNSIVDARVIGFQAFVDCMRYGARGGILPSIEGGVLGYGKWLLLENGSIHGTVDHLYAESLWSLGVFGWNGASEGIEFNGCKIKMIIPEDNSLPAIDSNGHFAGAASFRGGYIGQPDNAYRRPSFYNLSSVMFDDVTLDGEPLLMCPQYARFAKLLLKWSSGGKSYGIADRITPTALASHETAQVRAAPFAEICLTAGRQRYNAGYQEISIDVAVVITVHATNGTATFDTVNIARLQVGDFVSTVTAWNAEKPLSTLADASYAGLSIGRVFSIVSNTVTLEGVPVSLATGTYDVRMYRLPVIRPATTGDTTSGTKDITNVSPIAPWVAGDRISGAGIPSGSWVTVKSGTTLTISINATATSSGVALYDALLVAT